MGRPLNAVVRAAYVAAYQTEPPDSYRIEGVCLKDAVAGSAGLHHLQIQWTVVIAESEVSVAHYRVSRWLTFATRGAQDAALRYLAETPTTNPPFNPETITADVLAAMGVL